MLPTFAKTTLAAACVLVAAAASFAGESTRRPLLLTPIAYTPEGKHVAPTGEPTVGIRVAGAECPTGSGNYCSDELPYCCPGVSVDPYCAKDVSGCTQ